MFYIGTTHKEEILLKNEGSDTLAHIVLVKSSQRPSFIVTTYYDEDWMWEFWMHDPSVYELVKQAVMNASRECADIIDLMETLDDFFEEAFYDYVVDDECNGDCENCEHFY